VKPFSAKRISKLDFPTPESPISKSLNNTSLRDKAVRRQWREKSS
jgi:hypothetical protein